MWRIVNPYELVCMMKQFSCDVRVSLNDADGVPFMGIGLVWLLQRVDRFRSISEAARDMDLSYPKAIKMIKRLEEGVGQPVVLRYKGGSERGGAELTEFGAQFIARYDRVQGLIKEYGEAQLRQEFFSER